MSPSRKITCILVMMLLGLTNIYAQTQDSKYKAQYLINLTNYMNWSHNEIIIGVYGDSPVFQELTKLTQQDSKVKISKLASDEEIILCDLIFLPALQSSNFGNIQKAIGQFPIVLVAENENLISKGAEMVFFKENKRLKFAVSQSALDDSGVQISPKFIERGVRVFD